MPTRIKILIKAGYKIIITAGGGGSGPLDYLFEDDVEYEFEDGSQFEFED